MEALVAWLALTRGKGFLAALAVASLTGCGGGGSDPGTAEANSPPVISGQPAASVRAGQAYSFQPTASDTDGDSLMFAAANVPSWATFSGTSGHLGGTPTDADVGTYSGITLSVSDGKVTVSLPAFSIAVTQIATGSATLSWIPPTQNDDGSPLTNLAGYRVRYGQSTNDLSESVSITNPSITTYVLDNLSPGTWFFGIAAVNSHGVESVLSSIASKTI